MISPILVIEITLDPNIVRIGDVLITWHGFFTAVGIFVGLNVVLRITRIMGLDEDNIYDLALVAIPAGILGARSLYVVEHWSYFSQVPSEIIRVNEGGISVWGALLIGVTATLCFAKWRRYPVRNLLDIVEGCSTNNHIIQTLPREIREGVTVAIIEDPDGNLIELMQDDNL